MKCKIQQEVVPQKYLNILPNSQVNKCKSVICFAKLPREIQDFVVEKISGDARKTFRATSRGSKEQVDNIQRRNYMTWKRQTQRGDITIDIFVSCGFAPPILASLIELFMLIRRENFNPISIYKREKAVASFYSQSFKHFGEAKKKIVYTLTMLAALKHLSNSTFSTLESSSSVEVSFSATNVYFGVLWSKKSINEFNFVDDAANLLAMIGRMIEIKNSLQKDSNNNVVNLLNPMDFNSKLVCVGSRVYFNRPLLKAPVLTCTVALEGSRMILESFKMFLNCSKFDFQNTGESLRVQVEFTSAEAQKSKEKQILTFYKDLFCLFSGGCSKKYFFSY